MSGHEPVTALVTPQSSRAGGCRVLSLSPATPRGACPRSRGHRGVRLARRHWARRAHVSVVTSSFLGGVQLGVLGGVLTLPAWTAAVVSGGGTAGAAETPMGPGPRSTCQWRPEAREAPRPLAVGLGDCSQVWRHGCGLSPEHRKGCPRFPESSRLARRQVCSGMEGGGDMGHMGHMSGAWGQRSGMWSPLWACRIGRRRVSRVGVEAGRASGVQTPPAVLLSVGPVSLCTVGLGVAQSQWLSWGSVCDVQGCVSVWQASPAGQAAVCHPGPPSVSLQSWGMDNDRRLTTRT